MEVGTEISQKIRSAIKAKLIELGAYVDDELPDYIMVMVANKKTQDQMVSDLNLFLGSNTKTFAEWLHGLLVKLQTVSIDGSSTAESGKEKKKSDSKREKKKKIGKNETSTKTKTVEKKTVTVVDASENVESQSKSGENSGEVEDVRQMLVTVAPSDELAAELETTEASIQQKKTAVKAVSNSEKIGFHKSPETSKAQGKRSISPESERRVQSTVLKKHKSSLTSVVASVSKDEDEEEYDPLCPAVGSVASVVKVTNRKSKIPPALQANKSLLVKAMGEAERSIAMKRKSFVSKQSARENSPSDVYTPKRRRSSGNEASPPPYIPSRKDSTGINATAASQNHVPNTRQERRQLLSSRDQKDLISRSRRMELFKSIGINRNEEPVCFSQLESRNLSDNVRERVKEGSGSTSTRAVSSLSVGQNLRIMARLGPAKDRDSRTYEDRNRDREKGIDLRNKVNRAAYSKDDKLQVIINPTAAPALKGSVASRLGKAVSRHPLSPGMDCDGDKKGEKIKSNSTRLECFNIEKTIVNTERVGGRLAVSKLAKSLVNRQCREAVLSVHSRPTGYSQQRRRRRSVSPDSRVVETGDEDDEEEEGSEEEGGAWLGSLSPTRSGWSNGSESQNPDLVNVNVERKEGSSEKEEKDPEDLAAMIGDDLEPEILNDTVKDELNLDLEDVNAEDDDLEKMIGVKSEEEKPKPGTRFIVTLDGVDERQFDAEAERKKGQGAMFVKPTIQNVPKLSSAHYIMAHPQGGLPPPPPAAVLLPQANPTLLSPVNPVYNLPLPHTLPANEISLLPREPFKPQPPKIPPFSINLKDSDDEVEDKESRVQSSVSVPSFLGQQSPIEGMTALQKAKLSERCKYWPACAAGSECEFHHPKSYCKTFPACKFGDKCLFIHPNCKFDSKCTRQDCPFTHTSRRPSLGTAPVSIAVPVPAPSPVSATICRFFPHCQNMNCAFLHPKPCRFGLSCQSSSCMFFHPQVVPSKEQLRWKAQQPRQLKSLSFPTPTPTPADPAAKFRQPVAKVSPMSATANK